MHAPLVRVDRVREGVERFGVARVPLHRDLDLGVLLLDLHGNDLVQDLFALRQVLDEVDEPTVGLEYLLVLRRLPLVHELDLGAFVQERELPEAFDQGLALEVPGLGEDLGIGPETDSGAGLGRRLSLGEFLGGLPALELLCPGEAFTLDLDRHLRTEGIHDGDTDTVQTPGDPVSPAAELAAGIQGGEHDLDSRSAILRAGDRFHRDPAAVIDDGNRTVFVDGDHDPVGVTGHRFIDGVVDYLVHQVVQTPGAGGPDIHPRAEPDVLDALQDLDVAGVISLLLLRFRGRQPSSDQGRAAANARCGGGARGVVARTPRFYRIRGCRDRVSVGGFSLVTCGFARSPLPAGRVRPLGLDWPVA